MKKSIKKEIEKTISKIESILRHIKNVQDNCCLLGIKLIEIGDIELGKHLDRIDSSKDYTLDNIQWVHKDINFMKRSLSQEAFLDLCLKICLHNNLLKIKA